LIGTTKAMEMILLAQRIDAQEALRLGLVNKVVPATEVMPTALKYAEAILQNAPLAVRAAKEAIIRGCPCPLKKDCVWSRSFQSYLLQSEDAIEGPRPSPRSASRYGKPNRIAPVSV